MRKVIITESQFLYLLKETGYPLNTADGADTPGNMYGNQVAVNNLDKDAKDNVTTGDKFAKRRAMSNRLFARSRNICETELDDTKVAGFGMKSDNEIKTQAANGGGKMIKNVADRFDNGGQRLNTTEVEISRMNNDKKNNPQRYQQNGGDNMVKTLKKTANQQRATGAAQREANKNIKSITDGPMTEVPLASKGTGKGHHSENEGNIYYY